MSRHKVEFFMETRENEGIDLVISPECTESMRSAFLPFSEFENAEECETEAKDLAEFWTTVMTAPKDGSGDAELACAFRKRRRWLRRKAVRDGLAKTTAAKKSFLGDRGKNQKKSK